MALITRYVNTGSTSGGNGTTNATTGANRAYNTLAAAEAAEQTDLVSAGDSIEILCSGSTADTTIAPFAGWTTGASNTITVKPHPDDVNTTGIFDSSKYVKNVINSWNQAIYIQVGWMYVTGLQITVAASNATGIRAGVIGLVETDVENCIIKGTDTTAQTGVSLGAAGASISRARNNVIYDLAGYGIRNQAYTTGGELTFYNNTIDNCLRGISISSNGASVDVRVINNLLTNNGTDYIANTAADYTANNITSDATSPDAAFRNKTITYTDAAGEDFSTADTDVTGQGADLTSDASWPFSTDIIGEGRGTSWDIGAFQVAASGGTAAITGTATASITEADIVAGGKTIIITLTGDTWVAAGATFDAQRQSIIDNIVSAQSETYGWNAVRSNIAVTAVVRTSDTVVTITLPAL